MSLTISEIKTGDYVEVKKGIKAPDFDYQLMDGWQGEVMEIHEKNKTVEIKWDTKTLLETPYQYLHDIINSGYDYETMNLLINEIELTNKREKSEEEEIELSSKIYWIAFYESQEKNEMYGQIFRRINISDYYRFYGKWKEYLSMNLKFPFEVEVSEYERGGMKTGTKIKLLDLDGYDDKHGIFGIGKYKMGAITTPICNLEAIDKDSKNYELLRDYVIWFANI